MYTSTETSKDRKYHDWSPPRLIFAGPQSDRTCEFCTSPYLMPRCALEIVTGDRSHNSHVSRRETHLKKPLSGLEMSLTCWRRLKENWKLATHKMVTFLHLIQQFFKCCCQIKHAFILVCESDFCNFNTETELSLLDVKSSVMSDNILHRVSENSRKMGDSKDAVKRSNK